MIKILKILPVALFINLLMLSNFLGQTAVEQRFTGVLQAGEAIKYGEFICSANNKYTLSLSDDDSGDVIFHRANSSAATNVTTWGDWIWETATKNYGQNATTQLIMQSDGNFVLYANGTTDPKWAQPGNARQAGSYVQLESTGYISIYSPTYQLLWRDNSTRTRDTTYTFKACELLKKFIPNKQSLCEANKISEDTSSFRQCLESCNNNSNCQGFRSFMVKESENYSCGYLICKRLIDVRKCSTYRSTCTNGYDGYVRYNPDPPPAPPKYDPPTKGDCEGGDMTGGNLGKKTFDQCTTECNNKTGCVAFSYNYWANEPNYGQCNLKQEVKKPFNSTSHYQCYTKPPMYDPPIDGSCVNIGNIIDVVDASTEGGCGISCNNDANCHGYNYKSGSTKKNCILIGANPNAPSACIINPDCTGWKWYKKIISNLTLTLSKDYSYSNVPCGYKVDTSKINESCYDNFTLWSGVKLSIKSLQDCASSCTANNTCRGFSYNKYSICRLARINSCGGTQVTDMTCPNDNIDLYKSPGDWVRVKDTSTFYSKINEKLNYNDGYGNTYETFTEGDCSFDFSAAGRSMIVGNLMACRDLCRNGGCVGFSYSPWFPLENCRLDFFSSQACSKETRIHNSYQYYHKNTFGCGDGISINIFGITEECDLGRNMFGESNNKDAKFGCSKDCKIINSTTEVKYWDCSNDQTKTTQWKTSKLEDNYNYLLVNQDQSITDVNNSKDYKEKFIEFVSINKTIPLDCSKAGAFVPNKFRYGSWFANLGWTLNDTMIMYSPPSTTSVSVPRKNRLDEGEYLLPNQFICSQNKKFKLTFKADGNLCLNKAGANNAMDHVWCLYNTWEEINAKFNTQPTAFSGVVMQPDCNFVLYKDVLQAKTPIYASNTHSTSNKGCYLMLQNDSKLMIYSNTGAAVTTTPINGSSLGSTTNTFTDCN